MAEYINIEEGKKLCEEYFKIGNWYCFDRGENIKIYMKIEKYIYSKQMADSVFFKGKGFSTIRDRMYTPKISQQQRCIYCWVKDCIEHAPIKTEEEVKEAFRIANQKIYELYF